MGLLNHRNWIVLSALCGVILTGCATSPETQAKMDEIVRTIPSCSTDADCDRKWAVARQWTQANSDFGVRSESPTRIYASSNLISQSGIGIVVTKVTIGSNRYQIVADLECFSAYSCPEILDMRLDFNRTVNGSPQ